MEGKLHQANENRKRRMMNQHGSSNTQKYRNNSSGGYTPKYNKPPAQNYRPNYTNNHGGPPKPGGNNNNPNNNNNGNNNNNNHNTGPRTGSNAVPVANKQDKTTITSYECGVVGHYSKECPKRLAKLVGNTAAPVQNQCRFAARKNPNNNGRYYNMTATEAQEAPQNMPKSAIVSARQDVPHLASTRDSLAVLSPTSPCSLLPLCLAGDAVSLSICCTPPGHLATYKRSAPPPPLSTPSNFPPSSEPPRPLYMPHCAAPPANCHLAAREPPQSNPTLPSTPGAPATIVEFAVVDTVALHQRHRSPTSQLAVDPLPPPLQPSLLLDEDDASPPSDPPLIQRSSAPRTVSVSKAH
ncbi:hypothetical protein QYE76_058304 [Lolium multiflorum]|uniref:CCHC-type domain-containing protein n=1 Tax=Lolium multiflorum TaxID=4521 RepID=A0AAD8T691_LOLMU|nr:hypothetical protein QYE76_058304 [Lolium multiflorum]